MTTINMTGRGLRGLSFGDVARREGSIAGIPVPINATDAQILEIMSEGFAEIVAAAGFSVLLPVRVATTAPITLAGAQTIDGVDLAVGDRVLVKNQTAAEENGIYVVAEGPWTRAEGFDELGGVVRGAYVSVLEGSTQLASAWVLTTPDPIIVNVTGQVWRLFRDMSAVVTKTGSERLTNKSFAGAVDFITEGGRIGVTSAGAPLDVVEGIFHLVNEGDAGVGLLVTSKWTGSAAQPFTNHDNSLFTVYNTTLDTSANNSWSISAANAYHKIPEGVTDLGVRYGVQGWATAVAYAGYVLDGTLDRQVGLFGVAGFQNVGSGDNARVNAAVGVAGLIYSDCATIKQAKAGQFVSNGGTGVIEENVAVYASAQGGTVSNHSFFGAQGRFFNAGQVAVGLQFSQASSRIAARGGVNSFEFGADDPAGYGSTVGATAAQGYPFVAFCAEADPAGNTFRTRGRKGAVIWSNLAGALVFSRLGNANAAGQSLTESARIDPNGRIVLSATPFYANNAAAIAAGLAKGTLYATATGELRIVV